MNKFSGIGMWIGIGGGIAGMIIAVISVITTVPGSMGLYITLGMLAFFGGMGFLFYKLLLGPMLNAARLNKTGIPAKAVITAVHDTGVTINNSPQVKLTLEIKNSFGQRYTTTCRVLVSRINPGVYQPGMEIPVKVDPKNENNVVVDFNAAPAHSYSGNSSIPNSYGQAGIDQLKNELEKINADNEAIRISGRAARAIVKKYTWLGSYVNGHNPFVELELEILPDTSPSFSGSTRAVIGEAAVEKYQPGKVVFVKYDIYDQSRVALDHS